METIETERLMLRRFVLDDAAFMVELLNDPAFIENIGDKGVRTSEDAEEYIRSGPLASYERHGFGLMLMCLRDGTPIGTCGLLKRDDLEHPDVGFAVMPAHWRKGYASEGAAAALRYGREQLGLERIVAVTSFENVGSAAVLEKIGLRYEGVVEFNGEPNRLFA